MCVCVDPSSIPSRVAIFKGRAVGTPCPSLGPLYPEVIERAAQRMDSERGTQYKNARFTTAEGAIGRLVQHLDWRRCATWGRAGAQAEALWRQITHNLMLLTGSWQPLVLKKALE